MDTLSNITDYIPSLVGVLPFFVAVIFVLLLRSRPSTFARILERLQTRTAVLIALVAMGWMAVTFALLEFKVHPFGGSDAYAGRAINIVDHGVFGTGNFPMAMYPPGYTFLLVPAFFLFGDSRWPIFLTNAVLLVGTAVLFRHLLLKLRVATGYANALALILILYPNRLLSVLIPLSDIPFSLFFLCAFTLMIFANEHPGELWNFFIIGLMAGGASLIRANGIALLLALLAGVWIEGGKSGFPRLRRIALLAGGFVFVILPWGIRNFSTYGELIPVSNNFGVNLAIGNNPSGNYTHNSYTDSVWNADAWRSAGGEEWNEAQRDKYLVQVGFAYIREHPGQFLGNGVRKILHTVAADASTFGMLETYTNMRSIVISLSRDGAIAPAPRQILYVLTTGGYFAFYVLNNALYYAGAFLVLLLFWKNRASLASHEYSFLAVSLISLVFVFVLFGSSRFKEPIPTTMLVVLGLGFFRGRGPFARTPGTGHDSHPTY